MLAVPLDHKSGANLDGTLDSNASSGRRGIFEGRRGTIRGTGGIFPANLGHSPHCRSLFDVVPIHAIYIGEAALEFRLSEGEER